MSIERVKIRAIVEIGRITVATPYVLSFNVKKQRGQTSTFDASLKVDHDSISGSLTGGQVVIKAGTDSSINTIFTGVCKSARISPCYDDPQFVILSISGADELSLLQGKRYTRRCRATNSTWVAITGVTREGLKSGKFAFRDYTVFAVSTDAISKPAAVGFMGSAPSNNVVDNVKPAESNKIVVARSPQIQAQILNSDGSTP